MRENPTRRRVLQTAGVVGGVAVAAAGCGFVGAGTRTAAVPTGPLTLGPASAVPVGGGTVYSTEQVVVTQPSEGVFHGFSAICTHQGCLVTSVADGAIHCPCHGSAFSISDGAVLTGPAPAALPQAKVTVSGTDLILGA